VNRHAANVAKWRPVVEIGANVRVRKGFTYAGKHGRVMARDLRPDGRVYWTVRLDISLSAGPSDREYYTEELEAVA